MLSHAISIWTTCWIEWTGRTGQGLKYCFQKTAFNPLTKLLAEAFAQEFVFISRRSVITFWYYDKWKSAKWGAIFQQRSSKVSLRAIYFLMTWPIQPILFGLRLLPSITGPSFAATSLSLCETHWCGLIMVKQLLRCWSPSRTCSWHGEKHVYFPRSQSSA